MRSIAFLTPDRAVWPVAREAGGYRLRHTTNEQQPLATHPPHGQWPHVAGRGKSRRSRFDPTDTGRQPCIAPLATPPPMTARPLGLLRPGKVYLQHPLGRRRNTGNIARATASEAGSGAPPSSKFHDRGEVRTISAGLRNAATRVPQVREQQAQAVGLFLNDSLLEIWPTGSLSQRQP